MLIVLYLCNITSLVDFTTRWGTPVVDAAVVVVMECPTAAARPDAAVAPSYLWWSLLLLLTWMLPRGAALCCTHPVGLSLIAPALYNGL